MESPLPLQPEIENNQDPKKIQKDLKLYRTLSIALGVMVVILLITSFYFGARAFINDDKITKANKDGQLQGATAQKKIDDKKFTEEKNSDFRTYTAPEEAGSFKVDIPKSWSLTIGLNESNALLTALAMPDFVESKLDKYALRFSLQNKDIDTIKKPLDNLTKEKDPKKRKLNSEEVTVSGIKGIRYTGLISSKIPNGTLTLIPLRDKTYSIQTDDNDQYLTVYNAIVKNLQLNP